MTNKKLLITIGSVAVVALISLALWVLYVECVGNSCTLLEPHQQTQVNSFEQCAQQSGQIMESYPRQCRYGDKTFIEEISPINYKDKIEVSNLRANQLIKSPITLEGKARGSWYFEASFPVKILDANNNQLGIGIAQAQDEWMTTEYVPFKLVVTFTQSTTPTGYVVFEKDNASGLPEFDDALKVPVRFENVSGN
jgi:hypothetical protein